MDEDTWSRDCYVDLMNDVPKWAYMIIESDQCETTQKMYELFNDMGTSSWELVCITKRAQDHCHETGKIRGLLCHSCNTSLGGFKDSLEMLQRAMNYLEQHG